jgi:hypothetical protein
MDELPIAVIGWLFAVACALALVLGIGVIISLHFSGTEARKHLASRVVDDTILFGIWILGLAGSIGLLLGKSWSPAAMQFFCWTLMALVLLSGWQRLRTAPKPRTLFALSVLLFAVPIVIFCVATIMTLRNEAVVGRLGG